MTDKPRPVDCLVGRAGAARRRRGVDPAELGRGRPGARRPGLPAGLPADRQPARRRGPHPGDVRPGVPLAVVLQARHVRGLAAPDHHQPVPRHGPPPRAHPDGGAARGLRPHRRARAPSPSRSSPTPTSTRCCRRRWTSCRPEFRAAVVLCDVEGLSYEEIGATLGVKLGTVRSRIHRGRAALRNSLERRRAALAEDRSTVCRRSRVSCRRGAASRCQATGLGAGPPHVEAVAAYVDGELAERPYDRATRHLAAVPGVRRPGRRPGPGPVGAAVGALSEPAVLAAVGAALDPAGHRAARRAQRPRDERRRRAGASATVADPDRVPPRPPGSADAPPKPRSVPHRSGRDDLRAGARRARHRRRHHRAATRPTSAEHAACRRRSTRTCELPRPRPDPQPTLLRRLHHA